MPRLLTFVVFLSIMITLTGSAHYYVWSRLVRDPGLSPNLTRALGYALGLLFSTIPASLFLRRSRLGGSVDGLVWLAMTWLGLLLFLTLALGTADLARGVWQVGRAWSHAEPLLPERRQAIARLLAGSAALVAGSLGLWALRAGLGSVTVKRVEVSLARLPAALSGTRIVQLSDVHVGPTIQSRLHRDHRPAVQRVEPGPGRHHRRFGRRQRRGVAPARGAARGPARKIWRLLRHRQSRVLLGRRRMVR